MRLPEKPGRPVPRWPLRSRRWPRYRVPHLLGARGDPHPQGLAADVDQAGCLAAVDQGDGEGRPGTDTDGLGPLHRALQGRGVALPRRGVDGVHLGGCALLILGADGVADPEVADGDGHDEQQEDQQDPAQHQGTAQTVAGLGRDRLAQAPTARLVRALRDRVGGSGQPPAADMGPLEARAPAVSTTIGASGLSRARPGGASGSRSGLP